MSNDGTLAREKWTDQEIVAAIEKAKGNLAHAARILKCWRSTIYRRMAKSPLIQAAYENMNEEMADEIEGKLIDMATEGTHPDHFKAVQFYLRTKARTRGYGDRLELAGDKDSPLQVTFRPADDA